MADENKPSIFNKRATEKLRSPDDLDKFVRVANPGVWLVLAACVALLIGLLSWGLFGTVSTSVSTQGVVVNNVPMCFLSGEKASKVNVGDAAKVDNEHMEVESISALPLSRDEAKNIVQSDYLVSTLVEGDWAYIVRFKGDGDYDFEMGVPVAVYITTERIPPISVIFGEKS